MQNMTDSRYGAWDHEELESSLDSIVVAAVQERGIAIDVITKREAGDLTIIVQAVDDLAGNTILYEEGGVARFTDPDDLIKWLDERFLHIVLPIE